MPARGSADTFGRVRRSPLIALASAAAALLLAAPAAARDVQVTLTARTGVVRPADGVRMRAWTFNGRVPGPVIRVREGDRVAITLRNADRMHLHSLDFHAAEVAPNVQFADVLPGRSRVIRFVARRPGVYMYHCGTGPVLEHIGMGMYGAIIVEPAAGRPPAREVVLVQSEFTGSVRRGWLNQTLRSMQTQAPRFVTFNGAAKRYVPRPIDVPVGRPVRIYLVDAGPTLDSAFHVVGEIFDSVQPDGNPAFALHSVSTWLVPAGGAAVFELTFDHPGRYPFVSHQFRWADAGAVGFFRAR